jgi:integrase
MTAYTAPDGEVRGVGGASTPIPSGRNQRLEASEEYRALREMTRAERIRETAPLRGRYVVNTSEMDGVRGLLAYAARSGYIAASPCDVLTRRERPKPGRPKDRFLTPSEIQKLLEHSEGAADLIVPMLLFSGLRVAELLGLTWQDIEFKEHVIRVRYQMSRKGKRTALKTDAGRREVIMMDELARRLRKKRVAARFSADQDLIVGNGVGNTLGYTKLLRAFRVSATDAGIEGATPHTCRHTFASILI